MALAKRLVAVSDVAAESFRPGVLDRLGLGYEALHEVKRDIVLLCRLVLGPVRAGLAFRRLCAAVRRLGRALAT